MNVLSLPSSTWVALFKSNIITSSENESRSHKIPEHARGAGRTVGFDGFEIGWRAQRANHRIGNRIRCRRREFHAPSGAISVEPVRDVKILLEMVLERKVEERRSGRGELHAGGEAALHHSEVARRQMAVEVRHESTHLDTAGRVE